MPLEFDTQDLWGSSSRLLSVKKASGVSQDCWEDYGDEVFEPLGVLVVRSPATPEPGPNPTRPGPTRPEEARPGPSPARPRANPSPKPTRPDPKFDPDQPDRSLARPEPGPTPTRPAPTPGPSDVALLRVSYTPARAFVILKRTNIDSGVCEINAHLKPDAPARPQPGPTRPEPGPTRPRPDPT